MISFDIFSLDCFLAVVETGKFTSAADRVGRTQSAISQQISKIEQQVGKPLFIRGKRLSLTTEGEIFLNYAKDIIRLKNEANDRLTSPALQGEIRFGLPEDFSDAFLSKTLRNYGELHPGILLKVECDLTLSLYERFKNHQLDLVLLKMDKPEDFPNGINIWNETLEWIGNEELFEDGDEKSLPLILSPEPCVYRSRAIKALEQAKIRWHIVLSSHSLSAKLAAVKAGLGVTVLSRNIVPNDLKIIKRGAGIPNLLSTHICLLKHQKNNPVVNSFEKHVIENMHI